MPGRIFLIQQDGKLNPMEERPYQNEALLQKMLEDFPEVLAGHDPGEGSPRHWLLVSRELGIPDEIGAGSRWSLDHLFLDEDGVPTLVEVKRSSDGRARREVVAQMLDYASNAVLHLSAESIRATFDSDSHGKDLDPAQRVRGLSTRFDTEDETGVETFWQEVQTNLRAGRIRMVFVADKISRELLRIVEFLNGQMSPAEVIAIEVRQFVGGGLTSLVPTILGRSIAAEDRKRVSLAATEAWDEERFFVALEKRFGPDAVKTAREILDWSKTNFDRISWGYGALHGSFKPIIERRVGTEQRRLKMNLFSVWTYGRVEINFEYLRAQPPFDSVQLRTEFLQRLQGIPGTEWPTDSIEVRPRIPLNRLTDTRALKIFQDAVRWVLDRLA